MSTIEGFHCTFSHEKSLQCGDKKSPHVFNIGTGPLRPEADDGKDDDGGKDGGGRVGDADEEGVLQGVVLPLAVAGEGDEGPRGHPQGEKDLGGRL